MSLLNLLAPLHHNQKHNLQVLNSSFVQELRFTNLPYFSFVFLVLNVHLNSIAIANYFLTFLTEAQCVCLSLVLCLAGVQFE